MPARFLIWPAAVLLAAAGHALFAQTKRPVNAADFPRAWTGSPAEFDRFIAGIAHRTIDRVREGENDHFVAFVLQSSTFTREPKIEPALSAMEFAAAQGRVPGNVLRRMDAFLEVRPRAGDDERIPYFQNLVAGRGKPYLIDAYARTMRFLHEKESRDGASADLYQERGYATDTQVEASYPVWMALSVLKSLEPALAIHRVLIVGPGLDLAPRTGMIDLFPPQSYQPFAVADALLALGMSSPDRLQVHCVDVNPLVVRFFRKFPGRLKLVSGLPRDRLSAGFQDYFRSLARAIGKESALDLPAPLASHLAKSLTVRDDIARKITAAGMNIITERYDPSPVYDLVVATNVFVYFNDRELRLALANIRSMLRPDGYLVHNELRPEVESLGRESGLAPVQARTIRISAGVGKPLLDSFVIQRRADGCRQ